MPSLTTPNTTPHPNAGDRAEDAPISIVEPKMPPRNFGAEMLNELAYDHAAWQRKLADPNERNEILKSVDAIFTHKTIAVLALKHGIADSPELRQLALVALNRLLDTYDPVRGKLSGYITAFHPLRTIDGLRANGDYSRREAAFFNAHGNALHRLAAAGAPNPTVGELAAEMGMPERAVAARLEQMKVSSTLSFSDLKDETADFDVAWIQSDLREADGETRRYFARVLAPLPAEERFVVTLRFCENFSVKETANILQISESAVSQITSQGLQQLREIYGSDRTQLAPDEPAPPSLAPPPELALERSAALHSFIRAIRGGEIPVDRRALASWVDSPAFMAEFICTRDRTVARYRSDLLRSDPKLVDILGREARTATARAFAGWFPNLDVVEPSSAIIRFLGMRFDADSPLSQIDRVRRRLIELEFLSPERPEGHPVNSGRWLSAYLRPDIVGEAHAAANTRAVLKERFPTLDDVTEKTLGRGVFLLLGLSKPDETPRAVEVLIKRFGFSTEIPANHTWKGARQSRYLDPAIVGESMFERNRRTWFRDAIPSLDDIPVTRTMAALLGVDTKSREVMARRALDLELISPRMPLHHPAGSSGGSISHYLNPRIVSDPTIFKANIRTLIAHYGDIDGFDPAKGHFHVCAQLTGEAPTARALARWAVHHGVMGSEMPADHPLKKGNYTSAFVDPKVVGFDRARSNLAGWIARHVRYLDKIPDERSVIRAMNETSAPGESLVEGSAGLARALVERGWLSPIRPSSHVLSARPPHFYFEGAIVGDAIAHANFKGFIRGLFPTLDDVHQAAPHITAVAGLLGVKYAPDVIIRTLLAREILDDTRMPPGHPLGQGHRLSFYCHPDIVGFEQARKNLRGWVESRARTITDLPKINLLIEALNLTRFDGEGSISNPRDAAIAVVARQWVSPLAPADYTPSTKSPSLYLDPLVVGEAAAKLNRAAFASRGLRGFTR